VQGFKQPTRRCSRTTSCGAFTPTLPPRVRSRYSTGPTTKTFWPCACTNWFRNRFWQARYDFINQWEKLIGDGNSQPLPVAATCLGRRWLPAHQVDTAVVKIPVLRLEIVKRSDDMKGFVVQPRRWLVERTCSCFGRNLPPRQHFENLAESLLAFHTLACIQIAIRRLAR
jgi:transposase